jgi:hypothetical protein
LRRPPLLAGEKGTAREEALPERIGLRVARHHAPTSAPPSENCGPWGRAAPHSGLHAAVGEQWASRPHGATRPPLHDVGELRASRCCPPASALPRRSAAPRVMRRRPLASDAPAGASLPLQRDGETGRVEGREMNRERGRLRWVRLEEIRSGVYFDLPLLLTNNYIVLTILFSPKIYISLQI